MNATPFSSCAESGAPEVGYVGRIPVRNLWLLMLYASDFRQKGTDIISTEDMPDDIPDMVAEVLAYIVEQRLRRNLSHGYQPREAVLSRMRGHVDLLKTERRQLLSRGLIACRYEELTVNTPRNRYVRAALESIAGIVNRSDLRRRCRILAGTLKALGVSGTRPSRAEMSADRLSRHDSADQFMIAAAKLALDLALPKEEAGQEALLLPDREEHWVRRLFERAVGGFYKVVFEPKGWQVDQGLHLNWDIEDQTQGMPGILPAMKTDIVLHKLDEGKRIVIDTKFNAILTKGWYKDETLRSGYIYQIYAYLRSQDTSEDHLWQNASGLLLHPSIGQMIDEKVTIQGHAIRFATVDLAASPHVIRERLIEVILENWD